MSSTERREKLIRYLCMNDRMKSKELARKLEVSDRTILRDVSLLSRSKPITATTGKDGGIYITDRKKINLLYLKNHEIDLLHKIYSNPNVPIKNLLSAEEMKLLEDIIKFYKSPENIKNIK